MPFPPSSLRFGYVTPDLLFVQFRQHGATVISLVGYHLFHSLFIDFPRRGLRHFQRLVDRGCISLVGGLQRHRQQRSRRQIHRVLGFVRQVRASVFHLRDPRIRVAGLFHSWFDPFFFRFRSSR